MRSLLKVALCGTAVSLSPAVIAQTSAEVFAEMDKRQRAMFEDIETLSVMKVALGQCTLEHFEKAHTDSVDYMRPVPLTEVLERISDSPAVAQAPASVLEDAAGKLTAKAPEADAAVRTEMAKSGIPPHLSSLVMDDPRAKPWLSPKPSNIMNTYALMLNAAARGKKENARIANEAAEEADARADALAAMAERTHVVGRETLIDRPAIHLVAEDLDYQQSGKGGAEFTLDTLHLWVDAEHYVPLRMRMEGSASEGGETRQMRIEHENTAYRTIDSCPGLYEPQRVVMRVAGVLSPKEQKEMEEAQQKMAQMEAQLAAMPQAQRDFIMRQMGPQLEMAKKMAAGQGMEFESLTVGARCNAGLPTMEEIMQTVPGVSAASCIGFVGE